MISKSVCDDLRVIATQLNSSSLDAKNRYLVYNSLLDAVIFYRKYWNLDLADIVVHMIRNLPLAEGMNVMALELQNRGCRDGALALLEHATALAPEKPYSRLLTANLLRTMGEYDLSRKLYATVQSDFPGLDDGSAALMCDVDELFGRNGDHYQVLADAHLILRPDQYIEIGVSTGKSLALARKGTHTIGIDPACMQNLFYHSLEVVPQLYRSTSDDYFAAGHAATLLREAVTMAFIDGDHTFEQALADFLNLERVMGSRGVIFVHDCLPVSPDVATKKPQKNFWSGDVWRLLPCLKLLRPELRIVTFPVSPSGLGMITGLKSTASDCAATLETAMARCNKLTLPSSYAERVILLNVTTIPPDAALRSLAIELCRPS